MSPRLMVVDDEEKVRKYLSRLLKNRGFQVETAADGATALTMIKENDFDVVLLDVLMPGMDGIAVLKEIKKLKPLTEVIMLTGNASVETGIEGMRLGAFDYLLKPVDLENLYLCLKEAMEQKKIRESSGDPFQKQKGSQ
ncbi:MAG: response regulator [Desulfobacteraceae bacterium]|nr:MAG: response regulator [Desulfobacteraceae bacterium]